MVRFVIIGAVIAAAFTLYALVDAAMSDAARARGLSKPVWVVLIVVLPVIGAILWFTIGKARGPLPAPQRAPDDDPRFAGTRMSDTELEEHMRELEDRLRELDAETFPGEEPQAGASRGGADPEPQSDAGAARDGDAGKLDGADGTGAGTGTDADSRAEGRTDGGAESPGRRPDHPGEAPSSRQ